MENRVMVSIMCLFGTNEKSQEKVPILNRYFNHNRERNEVKLWILF